MFAFCYANVHGHEHRKQWNNDDHCKLMKCKNNIITKSTNHFQSKGFCYIFGNRGLFDCVDDCSVGVYATKKQKEDFVLCKRN